MKKSHTPGPAARTSKAVLPLFAALSLLASHPARAGGEPEKSFFSDWLNNVNKVQEAQPYWESLIGMSSSRLTQGFRYGYGQQYLPGGTTLSSNGSGKVELIVGEDFQVQIGTPAYMAKQGPKTSSSGWADETLLGKYRFLSANEENGNYIVSGLFGFSIPSGSGSFSSHSIVFTPTLAAGKGWGTRQRGFDIQSTLSAGLPDHNLGMLGMPVIWSTALQAHPMQNVWPEVEASYTHWYRGANDGKNQLVLTYGIVFGRFGIKNREKMTFGIGYQEPRATKFSSFNRGWVFTAKLSF